MKFSRGWRYFLDGRGSIGRAEKLDRMHCYHRRRRLEFFLAAAPAISFRKCIPTLAIKEMRRNFNPSRYNFHVKWREFPANVCERICAIRRTTSVRVPVVLRRAEVEER